MSKEYDLRREQLVERDRTLQRPDWVLSTEFVQYRPDVPTPDQVLHTVMRAMTAQQYAESYRDFNVGASAHINRGNNTQIVSKHGANYKNGSGDSSIDTHAEQLVLSELKVGDEIAVLVVVGDPQPDHGSGLESPTLHPCGKCRKLLDESEHITPSTLIVSISSDGKDIEWGTIDEYKAFHSGERDKLQGAGFDSKPQVLGPLPLVFENFHVKDANDIDTQEWDTKVTIPLMERQLAQLGEV